MCGSCTVGRTFPGPVIRLAGGLEVNNGAGTAPSASRDRTAFALIAVNTGGFVTVQEVIEELWGSETPDTCREAVHSYLHRVRDKTQCVIHNDLVAGYKLTGVLPHQVDVLQFVSAVDQLQNHPPHNLEEEAAAWQAANALLSGRPFVAVKMGAGLEHWARKVEARQRAAMCRGYHIRLQQGRHARLTEELWAEWTNQPEREDLACLLMVAFYRSMRAANAIDVYRLTRQELQEGYGRDPSKVLQTLHQLVLQEDELLLDPTRAIPGL